MQAAVVHPFTEHLSDNQRALLWALALIGDVATVGSLRGAAEQGLLPDKPSEAASPFRVLLDTLSDLVHLQLVELRHANPAMEPPSHYFREDECLQASVVTTERGLDVARMLRQA